MDDTAEPATGSILWKKGVLKNFANSKTPVLVSLFNKFARLKACNFIEVRLQHKCFPVKFLPTPIYFEEHLLLILEMTDNNIFKFMTITNTNLVLIYSF